MPKVNECLTLNRACQDLSHLTLQAAPLMLHDTAQLCAAMFELGAYTRLSNSAGWLCDDLCTPQMGIFFNAGQVCSATSRLIVHKDIEKQLLAKLKIRAESICIADPLDAATRMGPIISEQQYNKVLQYIEVSLRCCCLDVAPKQQPVLFRDRCSTIYLGCWALDSYMAPQTTLCGT